MHRYILVFASLCLVSTAQAERYTLQSAVTQALSHNPDLAAARLSIEEARGRLLQAGRRANPEIESELKPNVRGREYSFGVAFVQRFPVTNRLRLEKAVSFADVTAAEAEVRAAERSLSNSVRVIGVKYLSLREERNLKQQQIANSKELAAAAAKIAASGEGSPLEAAQYELEAQKLALDVLRLESEQVALSGEARPLLGLSAHDAVEFTGALPPVDVPAKETPDLLARPEYQAAQAKLEAAQLGISLARAGKWEDIGIGFGAEIERTEDAPEGLETDGFVGLKLSFPLPLWNKNEGKIQEAEAAAGRAKLEAEALAAGIRNEAAAAAEEMRAAKRILLATSETLIPKARELEGRVADFYKQGQPGTLLADLLRSRESRLGLEQARLEALRAFHLARTRYEAAMGR